MLIEWESAADESMEFGGVFAVRFLPRGCCGRLDEALILTAYLYGGKISS